MENYEKIQQSNILLISDFKEFLGMKGLSKRTIKNHISNVEFLLEYLVYEDTVPEEVDVYTLESFIRWCIDKWMFNTASGFVSALHSIGIFYEYLKANGKMKNINDLLAVCNKRDFYLKKFNSHEKLLRRI